MIFSTPLAALGLLTAVGLTALYCFRRKSPPKVVSSLMFWPQPPPRTAASRRRDRLRLPPIFWLELFILLTLVAAALTPLCWRPGQGTLHVLLDDSPSMHADPALGQRASRPLNSPALGQRASRPLNSPAALAAEHLARERRSRSPDAIRVRTITSESALERALAAAKSIRVPEDEILVLTDHAPAAPLNDAGIHWRAFGTPTPNCAITAVRRLRKSPAEDSLYLEVRRFGKGPNNIQLTLSTGEHVRLEFDADGRARFRGTVPASDQPLTATIPPDALAADNTVTIPPPDVPSVDTAVAITNSTLAALVHRALDATGFVHRYTTPDQAQLLVTDDPAHPASAANPYRLVFTPGGKSSVVGPIWSDPSSDLLDGVALAGEAYALAATPLPGAPLATLGATPLITATTNGCFLAFANPALAFFRSPAFPALVQNVLVAADSAKQSPRDRRAPNATPTPNVLDENESDLTTCSTTELHTPAVPSETALRTASIAWLPALLAAFALLLHFIFIRRRPTLIVLALALLAIARPILPKSEHRGSLIVVADHSRSMPADATQTQEQLIKTLAAKRPANASLGIVTFGADSAIEKRPAALGFEGFVQQVNPEGSDLAAALEKAAALADPDAPSRFLVLSDGLFTTPPAAHFPHPVDTLLQTRPFTHDLFVSRLDVPSQVDPHAIIPLTAWVQSPETVTNDYTLLRGTNVLTHGRREFAAGFTPLIFRDRAGRGGLRRYTLRINPSANDPCPENNSADTLVAIEGSRPLLFLTEGDSAAAKALREDGLAIDVRSIQTFTPNLAALENYAGVVLENLPAKLLATDFQRGLVAYVSDLGRGLAMTGGDKSYGPGGWYKSSVEDILPVTLELRQEHRKYALALAIVMDRSGSMACLTDDGRTKMDMANLGAAGAIDMLSPADQAAVIAVDSQPHLIVALKDADEVKARRHEILSVKSEGGGIFVKEGIMAALRQLEHATTPIRHIILFADASDSEEPGDYETYLAKAREAGITLSVIALGRSTDCDSDLLRKLAQLGGGECWFEERAEEIPRLFMQDTFLAAKETMCTNVTPLQATANLRQLSDRLPAKLPNIGGYNLTYLRPEAEAAILTEDEDHAPLVATRRVGIGRTLAFTGELSGPHAAPLMTSPCGSELAAAMMRWLRGDRKFEASGFTFDRKLVAGGVRVTAVADDDNPASLLSQAGIPIVVVKDLPGRGPKSETYTLRWESADTLSCFVPLAGGETCFIIAKVPAGRDTLVASANPEPVRLPPICLPYSAEYRRAANPTEGKVAMERLAAQTGGTVVNSVDELWDQLPTSRHAIELAPFLYLLASALFLALVFARRLGFGLNWSFVKPKVIAKPKSSPTPAAATASSAKSTTSAPTPTSDPAPTSSPTVPTTNTTASALSIAKRRARR